MLQHYPKKKKKEMRTTFHQQGENDVKDQVPILDFLVNLHDLYCFSHNFL